MAGKRAQHPARGWASAQVRMAASVSSGLRRRSVLTFGASRIGGATRPKLAWRLYDRELQLALVNQPRNRVGSDAIVAIVRQGGQAKGNGVAFAQGGKQGILQSLAHRHTQV